ncbi:MAG: hypothetical protein ACREHE_06045 [Rhizomicrobium sp.]
MSGGDLDALLAAPLPPVEDMGFCRRVTDGVARAQRLRTFWTSAAAIGAGAILLPFMPLGQAGDTIATVSWILAGSAPLAIAIAMLVLSNSLLRWVAD